MNDVIKARICIKRSGKDYEQFRRELSNQYNRRSSEYPQDVVEANRQLEYYRPIFVTQKKITSSLDGNCPISIIVAVVSIPKT